MAMRMIGEVYRDLGDFMKSLEHQKEHLKIAREIKDLAEEQRALATRKGLYKRSLSKRKLQKNCFV